MARHTKAFYAKQAAKKKEISFAQSSSTATVDETGQQLSEEIPQQISEENPQETSTENFPKPIKERLSWPISESGKFDVGGFRKETAEQAREIAKQSFLDPEFRKWAGIEQETGAVAEAIFPNSFAGSALDFLASIETLAMAKKTGLTYDECHRFMAWNEKEHSVLDPQAARLARKHIPAKWLENSDMFLFISTVAILSAGKMRMASEYAAKRLEQIGNAKDKDMGKPISTGAAPSAASMTSTPISAPPNGERSPNTSEGKSLE